VIAAAIFASFRSSWPRDVRSLSISASILIARIPLPFLASGQAYAKSEAVLRIARELPRWEWTCIFQFILRVIRDATYDLVARNRYRWFGRRDACILPNSDRSWPS
jgi:predicted DCC family thiol-disulfide oxidoreductase YuxK